jgi:hypothetical protein
MATGEAIKIPVKTWWKLGSGSGKRSNYPGGIKYLLDIRSIYIGSEKDAQCANADD